MLILISYQIFQDAMEGPLYILKISEREYSLKTAFFIYYMEKLLQIQKHQSLTALKSTMFGYPYITERGKAVNIQTTN